MNGNGHGNNQGYDAQEDRGEGSKRNPLLDLMDSERTYVEQLALVIRASDCLLTCLDHTDPVASCGCLVQKGFPPTQAGWNVSMCRSSLQSKQSIWQCRCIS